MGCDGFRSFRVLYVNRWGEGVVLRCLVWQPTSTCVHAWATWQDQWQVWAEHTTLFVFHVMKNWDT